MGGPTTDRMREDWDRRARENAFHYVASGRSDWTEEEFAASGEESVRQLIVEDAARLCPDGDWKSKKLLEIGCGAGRMTLPLTDLVGEVHAVDVSSEMLAIARRRLSDKPNAVFHQIDGRSLEPLGSERFDIVFSTIVFQHIPELEAIESLVADAAARTRPGGVLKLQVQGAPILGKSDRDTWLGATVSALDVLRWLEEFQLELMDSSGAGTQEMWLCLHPGRKPNPDAERRLLLDSQRAWETTGQRQAEDLIRWAESTDAAAERLREHLRRIYGSPAYRIGRRLGLAPQPIDESESESE